MSQIHGTIVDVQGWSVTTRAHERVRVGHLAAEELHLLAQRLAVLHQAVLFGQQLQNLRYIKNTFSLIFAYLNRGK